MTSASSKPNPFTANRWETDSHHKIWISPLAAVLGSTRACYISGLRGTGKTVLMNCLDPLAALGGTTTYLNTEALPKYCIGVYINILAEFTDYFEVVNRGGHVDEAYDLEKGADPFHALAFQSYLIFNSISQVFRKIDEYRRHDVLTYTVAQEQDFVQRFAQVWEGHFEDGMLREFNGSSLLDCASLLSRTCMSIRVNSVRLYSDRVRSLIEGVEPIKFYQSICKCLNSTALLDGLENSYNVKICLDDVHRFHRSDQILLNNIVAVNSAPIGWNLSFITGQYDQSSTQNSASRLTKHDVERIDLNYENNDKLFRHLCNKMYQIRVNPYADQLASSEEYSRIVGRPNASVLFSDMLERTQSHSFKHKILDNLNYVADQLENLESASPRAKRKGASPKRFLYQTYIFNVLFGGDREKFERFLKDRTFQQIDNYFRQKNVAALICAASELGRTAPYAGQNVLISLSDGCVRDFLGIMHVIYENLAGLNFSRRSSSSDLFNPSATGQISIGEQTQHFLDASQRYLEDYDLPTDRVNRVLSNIVFGVGILVRLLQTRDMMKALSMPERGAIEFDFGERTLLGDYSKRSDLLRRALLAGQYVGVVRILQGTVMSSDQSIQTDQITFRLHRITAPAFKFSSRGPMRKIRVDIQAMFALAVDTLIDHAAWAEKVYSQVTDATTKELEYHGSQGDLFGEDELGSEES